MSPQHGAHWPPPLWCRPHTSSLPLPTCMSLFPAQRASLHRAPTALAAKQRRRRATGLDGLFQTQLLGLALAGPASCGVFHISMQERDWGERQGPRELTLARLRPGKLCGRFFPLESSANAPHSRPAAQHALVPLTLLHQCDAAAASSITMPSSAQHGIKSGVRQHCPAIRDSEDPACQ